MTYQSVMSQRQGTGSSGVGFAFATVTIKEVHPDTNICLAMDTSANTYQLGINKRGIEAWPQVGDTWLIDRSMGHWALRTKITDNQAPAMTGFYNLMDPDLLRLMTILKDLGLVQDQTTMGTPTTPPSITGSKNRIPEIVRDLITTLDFLGIIKDETTAQTVPVGVWQKATYTSPFQDFSAAYQGARYRIDYDGFVSIEGMVQTGSTPVSGAAPIFTLPTGFRPPKNVAWPLVMTGTTVNQLDVLSTGVVQITHAPAGASVSFATVQAHFSVDA